MRLPKNGVDWASFRVSESKYLNRSATNIMSICVPTYVHSGHIQDSEPVLNLGAARIMSLSAPTFVHAVRNQATRKKQTVGYRLQKHNLCNNNKKFHLTDLSHDQSFCR